MSDNQPNWIELAKIVSGRIANRKDVEWKLALQHYGALGVCVYAAGNYLKDYLHNLNPYIVSFGFVLLIVSFGTSWRWIYLMQWAHAFDANAYRYYMDQARLPETETQQPETPVAEKPDFKTLSKDWDNLNSPHLAWLWIHLLFSIMVHLGVIAILAVLMTANPAAANAKPVPVSNYNINFSMMSGDVNATSSKPLAVPDASGTKPK